MTPLSILYQDEFLVAIDKPAGLLVHPGREPEGKEWVAMKLLRDELGRRVYPVHRLDRPTSGVLLFALDRRIAGLVQTAFQAREVDKVYLAAVFGEAPPEWECRTPLSRGPAEGEMVEARTGFERVAFAGPGSFPGDPELGVSLVRAKPVTGRFHQIRRHLLEAGHPIVGDYRYVEIERCDHAAAVLGTGSRMLLQAKSLELTHPCDSERLRIEAPADPEFVRLFPDAG